MKEFGERNLNMNEYGEDGKLINLSKGEQQMKSKEVGQCMNSCKLNIRQTP